MSTGSARARIHRPAGRSRPAPSLKKRIKSLLTLLVIAVGAAVATVATYLLVIVVQVSKELPSINEIGDFKPGQSTTIYFADGKPMAILAAENRRPVKLEQISAHLVNATIAVEDSRFFEHKGVDVKSIARAALSLVKTSKVTQGASTITQQLTRNIAELGIGRKKHLRRKVEEALIAVKIEQTFDKNEILELYLNQIYYGSGAYGCEAAARTYFHKGADKLTLGEAALLAGIPQRPSTFGRNLDAARRRREIVLNAMVATGKINSTEAAKARSEKLKLYKPEPRGNKVYGAPYFVNYVERQMVAKYGQDAVYSGWNIYTTLDSRMQDSAEAALRRGVIRSGAANQGALISLDPKTGYIRAMVGGVDYKKDQFNAVVQGKRQPGSTFKPIVYAAALDTDVCTLRSTYIDDPSFRGQHASDKWHPKNYTNSYSHRAVTVLTAIKQSMNTIAVKVLMETGISTVIDYGHRMGLSTEMAPYPPLALGASAVRPIELCSMYTIFMNQGKRCTPMGILRITDTRNEVVEEFASTVEDPRLRPETVEQISHALREVVTNGTGRSVRDVPNAIGKTGTTSDRIDAWFAGSTPELTTVVWVAHVERSGKKIRYLPMPGAAGGKFCAPIWREFMLKSIPLQQAYNKAPAQPLTEVLPSSGTKKMPILGPQIPAAGAGADEPLADPSLQEPAAVDDGGLPGAAPTAPISTAPSPGGESGPSPISGSGAPRARPESTRTEQSRSPDGGPRLSEPTGRPSAPRIDPGDEVASLLLCADSLRRANQWCPTTLDRRMRKRDAPGLCRTHRAPPGEGN